MKIIGGGRIRNPAIINIYDAVGERPQAHIVRDNRQSDALSGEHLQFVHHNSYRPGVEGCSGFVAQYHGRIAYQRACDCYSLLLAARQIFRQLPEPVAHSHLFNGFMCALARSSNRNALKLEGYHHIFLGSKRLDKIKILENEPDIVESERCELLFGELAGSLATHYNPSLCRVNDTSEERKERSFSTPGRADNQGQFTFFQCEIGGVQCSDDLISCFVLFGGADELRDNIGLHGRALKRSNNCTMHLFKFARATKHVIFLLKIHFRATEGPSNPSFPNEIYNSTPVPSSLPFRTILQGFRHQFWCFCHLFTCQSSERSGGDFEGLLSRGNQRRCPDRRGEWSVSLYDCRRAVFGHNNSVWVNLISLPSDDLCQDEMNNITGKWHHVVAVKDGDELRIYFNGDLDDTVSGVANCSTATQLAQDTGDLFLGLDYNGALDDVLIYRRALSGQEISELFNLEACCN